MFHSFVGLYGWDEARNLEKYPQWLRLYQLIGNSFFSHFGIYLLMLSFFLVGLNYHDRLIRTAAAPRWKTYFKLATLFLCFLGTQFDLTVGWGSEGFFIWDLYSYILMAYLIVFFWGHSIFKNLRKSTVAFALLFWATPFLQNILAGRLVATVDQIFFPTLLKTGANAWFVFPWIFLPLLAFCLGGLSQKKDLKTVFYVLGIPLLMALIIVSFVRLTFHPFLVDVNLFYLNVFWQNTNFNLLMIFPYLAFLVLYDQNLFDKFDSSTPLRWLSTLQWCKNFWFSFILHFGIIDMMTTYYDDLFKSEFIFNYSWLIVFIGTEAVMQALMLALKFYAWLFRLFAKLGFRR